MIMILSMNRREKKASNKGRKIINKKIHHILLLEFQALNTCGFDHENVPF